MCGHAVEVYGDGGGHGRRAALCPAPTVSVRQGGGGRLSGRPGLTRSRRGQHPGHRQRPGHHSRGHAFFAGVGARAHRPGEDPQRQTGPLHREHALSRAPAVGAARGVSGGRGRDWPRAGAPRDSSGRSRPASSGGRHRPADARHDDAPGVLSGRPRNPHPVYRARPQRQRHRGAAAEGAHPVHRRSADGQRCRICPTPTSPSGCPRSRP